MKTSSSRTDSPETLGRRIYTDVPIVIAVSQLDVLRITALASFRPNLGDVNVIINGLTNLSATFLASSGWLFPTR